LCDTAVDSEHFHRDLKTLLFTDFLTYFLVCSSIYYRLIARRHGNITTTRLTVVDHAVSYAWNEAKKIVHFLVSRLSFKTSIRGLQI